MDAEVCNTSFLYLLASQETETVHPVVEGNVDDRIPELSGARNEGGCIVW